METQESLGREVAQPWRPPSEGKPAIGGCFVCFERGGSGGGRSGEPGWSAAAVMQGDALLASSTVSGVSGAPYRPGLLALREGPLLEAAVKALPTLPDVLLVNATGRDHPRGAGLALHLGAVLGIPSVGVTHRPLLAQGPWPAPDQAGAATLRLDDRAVASWVRTRSGARPLVAHSAWRTDTATAAQVVLTAVQHVRTPEPLRHARELARRARATNPTF